MTCFFAQFDDRPCEYRADGQPDRCHLIKKTRLEDAGLSEDEVWDPRIIVPGCRRHHHLFDNKFFRLTPDQYPQSVHDFAAEKGFYWSGERDAWRFDARAAA